MAWLILPVDYIIYTSLAFLFYQLMIGLGGLNASISRLQQDYGLYENLFFLVTASSDLVI